MDTIVKFIIHVDQKTRKRRKEKKVINEMQIMEIVRVEKGLLRRLLVMMWKRRESDEDSNGS